MENTTEEIKQEECTKKRINPRAAFIGTLALSALTGYIIGKKKTEGRASNTIQDALLLGIQLGSRFKE